MDNDKMFDKFGLPRYLDMQAKMGYTKHIGGVQSTRELLALCGASEGKRLLNVGCGAGTSTTFIVENYGCQVVGVDLKENMIASARQWADRKGLSDQIEFRQADARDLPFEDDHFDIVISESVNIFIPDRAQALREYVRVVKPGGFVGLNEAVTIQTPSESTAKVLTDIVGHELLPPSYWEDLLQEAGLKEIVTKTSAIGSRSEARNQMGFLSPGEYLRVLGRVMKAILSDPYSRTLAKQATAASPKELLDYIGYGIFVGKK